MEVTRILDYYDGPILLECQMPGELYVAVALNEEEWIVALVDDIESIQNDLREALINSKKWGLAKVEKWGQVHSNFEVTDSTLCVIDGLHTTPVPNEYLPAK